MSRMLLDDGLTRKSKIKSPFGQTLEFTYRPMFATRAEQYFEAVSKAKDGPAKACVLGAAIAKQLVDWSETDGDGKPVTITGAEVMRLPYPAQRRLIDILIGFEAGDVEADDAAESLASAGNDLLAVAEGRNVVAAEVDGLKKT